MPSSLIFAALAIAWLLVLVPMIAKRRQEVARTRDSVLASRVLPRQRPHSTACARRQEVSIMSERMAEHALAAEERRFRPGRGGYDPEAAALAARARYVFRQRVVLGLLGGALVTLILALLAAPTFWWVHVSVDLALVGYLAYLRRQVRIEEDIRQRRAARLAGARDRGTASGAVHPPGNPAAFGGHHSGGPCEAGGGPREAAEPPEAPDGYHADGYHAAEQHPEPPDPLLRPEISAAAHPTAVALDLDDDDPVFDDLDPAFEPPYRRAAGE